MPAGPLEGVPVYLFTESGSYLGQNVTTNAQGEAVFSLPEQSYKIRADYLGYQFWSAPFTWADTTVTIDHGLAVLHVTKAGADVVGAPVYLFTPSGTYLGKSETTDENGVAQFLLPGQQYKFRVDHEASQYWSDVVTIIAYEENDIELNLDLLALDLTNDPNPVRFDGVPPEVEPEKAVVALLASLPGFLVDNAYAQAGSEKTYFFINDHLGTPQKVIDETGVVVWSADYRPFGEANVTVSTLENNFRFPGQYFDRETGLHYNWHRYYGPGVGRYLTADPRGLSSGLNLFAYASNNSLTFYDLLGLREWSIQRKGLAVSALVIGGSGQLIKFVSNCEDNKRITKTYLVVGYGLTFGLQAHLWGSTKGYLGETNVWRGEPSPVTGIFVSGPSAGLGILGGTLTSAAVDFSSFAEVYGASVGKVLGLTVFNFEGQLYVPWGGIEIDTCCEGT